MTRSDAVAGRTVVVTEKQAKPRRAADVTEKEAKPRARLTGTGAERRCAERRRCERLWQAMARLEMRNEYSVPEHARWCGLRCATR